MRLRHLIEARDTLRVLIGQDDRGTRKAMRSFDRMQAQKIRKPKKDREEAEEIAEQIEASLPRTKTSSTRPWARS